jgi:hypothetical protein
MLPYVDELRLSSCYMVVTFQLNPSLEEHRSTSCLLVHYDVARGLNHGAVASAACIGVKHFSTSVRSFWKFPAGVASHPLVVAPNERGFGVEIEVL